MHVEWTVTIPREIFTIYLATSRSAASAVLVANKEDKQVPIYFVIRILQRAEIGYADIEKAELPLVNVAR